MEIKDDIMRKNRIVADELEIGECFKYDNHIYLKAGIARSTFFSAVGSDIAYVDLTANETYPGYEFKGICVEPVKAHVQIKHCK